MYYLFKREANQLKKIKLREEQSERCLPSFHPSTPHILLLLLLLPPSLLLQPLNRIRASCAKWNVWRKPQPWNKAQETGRDRDGETEGRRCVLKKNGAKLEDGFKKKKKTQVWLYLSSSVTPTPPLDSTSRKNFPEEELMGSVCLWKP